jgi:hypothetical protein
MTEPTTALKEPVPVAGSESASYAPYAQLVKMLVPSSGCVALYDASGDLIWCSDGYEPPDFREIVEAIKIETNHTLLDGRRRTRSWPTRQRCVDKGVLRSGSS